MRDVCIQAATRIAVVAGIFCAILGILLLGNNLRLYRGAGEPKLRVVEGQELAPLKAALQANPNDAALIKQIREADQQQRRNYFRRQRLAETGGKLLVGGAFLFFVALQTALILRRPRFRDPKLSPRPENPAQVLAQKRQAVTATALVLSGLMAAFVWGAKREWADAVPLAGAPAPGATESQPEAAAPYPGPEELAKNWNRFRGPTGQGIADFPGIPETWDAASGANILWKAEIPLPGENSPLVWGDRIFLTGATEERREVFCFDANSGALLWREPVSTAEGAAAEPAKVMEDTGHAASTAITNGREVVAIFANGEIAGFSLAGKRLWARHLGTPENMYGYATSLSFWKDRVLVVFDQGEAEKNLSKIVALNAATGETLWSTPRPVNESWASPLVISSPAGDQVVTSADPWVIAYNPENGKELWKVEELVHGDVAPSPAFGDGKVFVAQDGGCLAAIGLDGKVAWQWDEGQLPDMCSLLTDGSRVYLLVYGVLSALDIQTGKMLWEQDFETEFKASPSLVNGKIWLLTTEGVMIMGQANESGFQETGRAQLGEKCGASPAFAPGRVYLRGKTHLYAIGAKAGPVPSP